MTTTYDDDAGADVQLVGRTYRFGMTMAHVMHRPDLAPLTRYLYASLTVYAGNAGQAWPSLSRIASDSGMSLSAVKEHLAKLEAAGIITRTRRKAPSGADRSTVITIHDQPPPAQNTPAELPDSAQNPPEGVAATRPPVVAATRPGGWPPDGQGVAATRPPVVAAKRPHNRRTGEQNARARDDDRPPSSRTPSPPPWCRRCQTPHDKSDACFQRDDDPAADHTSGLASVRAAIMAAKAGTAT